MLRFGTIVLSLSVVTLAQVGTPSAATDREKLSEIGSRVVDRTARARAAVAKKNKTAALQDVREALLNVQAIEAARPRSPQPLRVTLYTERVEISVNQPVLEGTGSANRSAPVNGAGKPQGSEQCP